MRIYPPQLPQVNLEPQAEDFCVIDVDSRCGQGVLALRGFRRGETLFRMNGMLTTNLGLHTLQLGPGLHMDDPYVAGKVLHSCNPNSRLDVETRLFVATRAIYVGDLLTMDYEETEDILFRSFHCCCGETNCRGEIVGRQRMLSTRCEFQPEFVPEPLLELPSTDRFTHRDSFDSSEREW